MNGHLTYMLLFILELAATTGTKFVFPIVHMCEYMFFTLINGVPLRLVISERCILSLLGFPLFQRATKIIKSILAN